MAKIRFNTFLKNFMNWPATKEINYGDPEFIRDSLPEGTTSDHVWTVLDVDGHLILTSGNHLVNRYGYIVSPVSHKNESIHVMGF